MTTRHLPSSSSNVTHAPRRRRVSLLERLYSSRIVEYLVRGFILFVAVNLVSFVLLMAWWILHRGRL